MTDTDENKIVLIDDGTLDTVLKCTECDDEFRFNFVASEVSLNDVLEEATEGEYDEFVKTCISEVEDDHECNIIPKDYDVRILAFSQFHDVTYAEAETMQTSYDEQIFEDGNESYLVVTDDEADDLWDKELDNYIDECILPELSEQYRGYFDDEKWKRDARIDGRAHSLNRYDGNEEYLTVDGTEYYFYRQN